MQAGVSQLLIEHIPGQTRACVMHSERLIRVHIDRFDAPCPLGQDSGAIYMGRVVNVVPSLQAAFVDIGTGVNGFLPVTQTPSDDIRKAVHEGQRLIVQVRKPAHENKGPALSANIELASEALILTPGRPGINISRKITVQEERTRLKSLLDGKDLPQDCGLIVRTQAESLPNETVVTRFLSLINDWHTIQQRAKEAPQGLLFMTKSFPARLLHSYGIECEIITDNPDMANELKELGATQVRYVVPKSLGLFETYGTAEQIEQALSPDVFLAGGGTLSIEQTRALVAIDVDMGNRTSAGGNRDQAIMELNREAIPEIQRALDLRNLSGQVFIDLVRPMNTKRKADLVKVCEEAFQDQKNVTFHGLTRLGLAELSVQRTAPSLKELSTDQLSRLFELANRLKANARPKAIELTPSDHRAFMGTNFLITRQWLEERLGGPLPIHENLDIAPGTYRIREF